MRMAQNRKPEGKKVRFQLDNAPERSAIARLGVILGVGFGVARNYSDISRDRWEVRLRGNKTIAELQQFCDKHLKGSKVPGSDPIRDGPVLLSMFQAAEKQGIVDLQFQKAERFLPEKGM